jgi:hypothetical protein
MRVFQGEDGPPFAISGFAEAQHQFDAGRTTAK